MNRRFCGKEQKLRASDEHPREMITNGKDSPPGPLLATETSHIPFSSAGVAKAPGNAHFDPPPNAPAVPGCWAPIPPIPQAGDNKPGVCGSGIRGGGRPKRSSSGRSQGWFKKPSIEMRRVGSRMRAFEIRSRAGKRNENVRNANCETVASFSPLALRTRSTRAYLPTRHGPTKASETPNHQRQPSSLPPQPPREMADTRTKLCKAHIQAPKHRRFCRMLLRVRFQAQCSLQYHKALPFPRSRFPLRDRNRRALHFRFLRRFRIGVCREKRQMGCTKGFRV